MWGGFYLCLLFGNSDKILPRKDLDVKMVASITFTFFKITSYVRLISLEIEAEEKIQELLNIWDDETVDANIKKIFSLQKIFL